MSFGNEGGGFRGTRKYPNAVTVQLSDEQINYLYSLVVPGGSRSDALRFLIEHCQQQRIVRVNVTLTLAPLPRYPTRYAGWDPTEEL
jgi:hypothetical protein